MTLTNTDREQAMQLESANNQALSLSDHVPASQTTSSVVKEHRKFSIKTLLIIFVICIVLPAWGFSAYVATQYAVTEKKTIQSIGRSHARSLVSSLDFRLESLEAGMATLALSRQLRTGDINNFYLEAKALGTTYNVAVGLVSSEGKHIFNTNALMGEPLSPAAPETKYAEAIRTKKLQYSSLFFGNISKKWILSISMPVMIDGEARFALIVGLEAISQIGDVFNNIESPQGWPAALIDDRNVIASRRPAAEEFVGKPAHPNALAVITEAESGWGRGTSIDNKPVYVFYHRLKKAPWTILVGVPASDIDGALWEAILPVFMAGISILALTTLAAWLAGRSFTRQLTDIADVAMAFRGGRNVVEAKKPSRVFELSELKTTLDSAIEGRNRYEMQLKKLVQDKELLMQEIHHRVKNSLQLVRGILSMQARSSSHSETKTALNDAAIRILTIADVHQHLYQGESTIEIHVEQYLKDLVHDLMRSLLDHSPGRDIRVEAPSVIWPSEKVVTLGLIITELVTNSVKYGRGCITIKMHVASDDLTSLIVEDEGNGYPHDFEFQTGGGLGSKLITSLIHPTDGSISIDRSVKHGRVIISLFSTWR
jgi:two-component sensor histidine kinase